MKEGIVILLSILMVVSAPVVAGQNSGVPSGNAGNSNLSVRPAALALLVEDQSIKLMLRDGTYLEAKVLHASEEALGLKVKHSEPAGRLKKGETSILTREVAVVYLKRKGTVAWPVALGVAGGFGGFLAGVYAGYQSDSAPVTIGLGIGLATAGAVGGALLGNEAAERTVIINVIP
jgi:hypothetical protein